MNTIAFRKRKICRKCKHTFYNSSHSEQLDYDGFKTEVECCPNCECESGVDSLFYEIV